MASHAPHDANPIWPKTETPWIQELQKQMYVVAKTHFSVMKPKVWAVIV